MFDAVEFGREARGQEEAGSIQRATQSHDHARPKRKTGQYVIQARITPSQPVQRRPCIVHFADGIRVLAFARPHAAEIEPQNDDARSPEAPRDAVNDLVMHCAPVKRMRMTDHGAKSGGAGRANPVLGLFQQSFQVARWSCQQVALNPPRHNPRRSIGTVIGELHVDAEIGVAQQLDYRLQDIAVAARNTHEIGLNRSLYLQLAVFDFLDDFARLLR